VIAVAQRAAQRVDLAVLDLQRKVALPWCSTRLDCFAPEFDGQQWAVGLDQSLLLIELPNFASDAKNFAFQAHWHVGDLPGPVRAVDWSQDALRLICLARYPATVVQSAEPCTFEYRWPDLTLARRYAHDVSRTGPMFFVGNGSAALICVPNSSPLNANTRSDNAGKQPWDAAAGFELHHYGRSLMPIKLALSDVPERFTWHACFATRTWFAQQFCGTDLHGVAHSISLIYPAHSGKPVLHIQNHGSPPALFGDAEHVFCAQEQHLLRVSIASSKVLRLML
jgi:hypothetical protein